jgi:hypothetical protein
MPKKVRKAHKFEKTYTPISSKIFCSSGEKNKSFKADTRLKDDKYT